MIDALSEELNLIDPIQIPDINNPSDCKTKFKTNISKCILSLNIRSVNKNFDQLLILLHCLDLDLDAVVLSECWTNCAFQIPHLDGYDVNYTRANRNRSDGVIVYTKTSLNASANELDIDDGNGLRVTYNDVNIIAIYRSPSFANPTRFIRSLISSLNNLSSDEKIRHTVIAGDANINIYGNRSAFADDYECFLHELGFVSAINTPTRVLPNHESCIDHIFIRTKNKATSAVIHSTVTDHYSTLLAIDGNIQKTRINYTQLKTIDESKLVDLLTKESWNGIIDEFNTDQATDKFVTTLQAHIRDCTTTKQIPHKKKKIKPWITAGLVQSIHKRDKLHNKVKKFPNNVSLLNYFKRYRNLCAKLITAAKENYYKQKLQSDNNDIKSIWNIVKDLSYKEKTNSDIRELVINNESITENGKIANELNKYFSSIGKNLADKLCAKLNLSEVELAKEVIDSSTDGSITQPLFKLTTTTEEEVYKIIKNMKTNSACGPDLISAKILKKYAEYLVTPLTHLFNCSLANGIFPSKLKAANVTPIFKAGQKSDPSNYRPISVLNVLAKILEKIVNTQLCNHLATNNMLSENQYGFRSNMGTQDAILKLSEHITRYVDANKKCFTVFLDLAKAFDTISHVILLKKLGNYGITGIALNWFRSYIGSRKQRTRIGDAFSNDLYNNYGVPQGSTLGPTLFLLYINGLCELDIGANIISYADDTALIFESNSWESVYNKAAAAMKNVKDWLDYNLLTLNVDKTKLVAFSIDARQQPPQNYSLVLHDCDRLSCHCLPIERVPFVKYLGVHVDKHLRWQIHIEKVAEKVRKLIYIFRNIRNVFDMKTLRSIYCALAQSLMMYGNIGWGGAAKLHLDPLIKAQKAVVRVINRKPYRYPSDLLFNDFEVLDIRQLYIKSIVTYFHHDTARHSSRDHKHDTRKKQTQKQIRTNTRFAQRHYVFLAPRMYDAFIATLTDGQKLRTSSAFKAEVTKWLRAKSRVECERQLMEIVS